MIAHKNVANQLLCDDGQSAAHRALARDTIDWHTWRINEAGSIFVIIGCYPARFDATHSGFHLIFRF